MDNSSEICRRRYAALVPEFPSDSVGVLEPEAASTDENRGRKRLAHEHPGSSSVKSLPRTRSALSSGSAISGSSRTVRVVCVMTIRSPVFTGSGMDAAASLAGLRAGTRRARSLPRRLRC